MNNKKKRLPNEFNKDNLEVFNQILEYYYNLPKKNSKKIETYLSKSKNYNLEYFKKFLSIKRTDINIYNPLYYVYLHNISYEDGEQCVNDFKCNKATSLKNYIDKYGENEGTIKFNEFKTRTLGVMHSCELYVSKYGNEIGNMLYKLQRRITNKRCVEFYLHKYDIDYKEALRMQSEYQRQNSGVHKDYYKIRNIAYISYNHLKGKTPTDDVVYRRKLSLFKRGRITHPDKYDDWVKYRNKVKRLTLLEPLYFLDNWELYNIPNSEYHIDHKVSLVYGFNNKIPEEIIASIHNLEILHKDLNIKKGSKCSMDINTLIRIYNENRKN